jgi:papain fold toxin 1 (glutamine deamidase) of polymorphic toxin system
VGRGVMPGLDQSRNEPDAHRDVPEFGASTDRSSAVVGFDKRGDMGHWFNAVNHAGTILAVDGQSGKLEKWPPSKNGLGFDESEMSGSDAIYFTADGEVVRDDHS